MKQIVALVILSLGIILAVPYAQLVIQVLLNAHELVIQFLADVFTGGQAGSLLKGLIGLLTIPFIVALIPALIYWGIRRYWFPYFLEIIWIVWLLQVGALLVIHKAAI